MLTLDNLPIFITVMVLLIVAVSLIPVMRLINNSASRRKLLQQGQRAQGMILKIWDTGLTVNDSPQVGFLLEVRPPAGIPFQAETKMLISRLQIPQFQPGALLEVTYAPQDHRKVAIVGPIMGNWR